MKEVLSLQQAILATLTYFDLLDFPLTVDEIEDYLYGWAAPKEAIEDVLQNLPNVAHLHGFYFLVRRAHGASAKQAKNLAQPVLSEVELTNKGREEIAELRKQREGLAQKLWEKTERFRWLLALCPFVKMVAVCNTLAYGNVKESSDIDLFIVTENGRLWTARFFMKILTQIFGIRAHHEKIAGRFCLSFFVSERAANLQLLAHEFDPHLAYFVKTMMPISGEEIYRKFLQENEAWTLPYFRRPLLPRLGKIQRTPVATMLKSIFQKVLNLFWKKSEEFFYQKQLAKDKARKKQFPNSEGIALTKDVFKFHEKDPRREIAEKLATQRERIAT